MTEPWSGYDSLFPSEHDLGQDWRKQPVLPPMHAGLILPYDYSPGRRPTGPRLDLTDGMVAEAVDILKDGGAVAFRMLLGYEDDLGCIHTFNCSHDDIRHAVETAIVRLSRAARTRLVLVAEPGKSDGIILDDKDGRDIPDVRFWVAAGGKCDRCKARVCSCPPTEAEVHAMALLSELRGPTQQGSATAAENGRHAGSPGESR